MTATRPISFGSLQNCLIIGLFLWSCLLWGLVAQETDDPFAAIPDFDFEEGGASPELVVPTSEPATPETGSLWRSEVRIINRLAAEGKIFHDSGIKDQSNQDNRLNLRALGLLFDLDLEASLDLLRPSRDGIERKRLSLVTNFYGQASNGQADNPHASSSTVPPELASFRFGFRQLYGSFFASLGGPNGAELELSAGKQPYAQGVSIFFNPMNYLDDSGSFFDTKNNWQLLLSLSWPSLALRLRYMPVLRFHSDSSLQANILEASSDDYSSWEYAFSFLESRNRRQLLSLEASLFVGQSNWQLFGYAMEKQRYDWNDGFYLAVGASGFLPFIIGNQYFQLYGEGLLGNGMSKLGQLKDSGMQALPVGLPPRYLWQNADLDKLQFRGLAGLRWTPLPNFDVYGEYRYDGSALSSDQLELFLLGLQDYNQDRTDPRQALFWEGVTERRVFGKPFSLTQHVVALSIIWRNIVDHLDLQAGYFLSLPGTSSNLQFKSSLYLLNRSLQLYALNRWNFPSFSGQAGAFGSVPYLGTIELGVELQN